MPIKSAKIRSFSDPSQPWRPSRLKGRGDVAQFIAHQAVRHGANPSATNGVTPIDASWRYFQDTNGVVVRLRRERFPEVYTCLKQSFGPPDREPIAATDYDEIGWYAVKNIGVAINFSYDRRKSQVIIIRPQTNVIEFLKRAVEVETKSDK